MSDAQDLRARLEALRAESIERIENVADLEGLDEARIRILGRKAPLTEIRSSLGKLPDDERKVVGQLANEVQSAITSALDQRNEVFQAAELAARWERERVDVTLPGDEPLLGSIHPLTQTMRHHRHIRRTRLPGRGRSRGRAGFVQL